MNAASIDEDYSEPVTLPDGTRVAFRAIRPSDKQRLVAGFERLSPESRHRRFFGHKNELTTEELRYLTEFDGVNHFALGAVEFRDGEEGDGVGVARFIRLEDPEIAELAITVVDDKQGQGLGRLLIERLLVAAVDRGIKRARIHVLTTNEDALKLFERWSEHATVTTTGEVITIEFPIEERGPPTEAITAKEGFYAILRLVAQGIVRAPMAFGLTLDRLASEAGAATADTEWKSFDSLP